jgi:hypothetical protein|tara:strand:- start:717 stop:866 length:150 start_codon:yes stop_codon:yes gene_type:complete
MTKLENDKRNPETDEEVNSIPAWWVYSGLSVRWFCFFQDIFNFKNPFKK